MRVRIRQHPEYRDNWVVETWVWYYPFWRHVANEYCKEDALKHAALLKHPNVEEVK